MSIPRCSECDSRLAHDQRYCLSCGARRGPLPEAIAAIIGEIRERGHDAPAPAAALAAARAAAPVPRGRGLPSPATASVALMAMLAFGVVVGSLTGTGGVESLANALVLAVAPPSHPATTATSPSGGGGNSSGASSPKSSAPAAQAPAQQQTITVAASPTGPGSTSGGTGSTSSGLLSLPPVKHVFVIMLSDQGYNQAFVASSGHRYLSETLRAQGELIADYYGVAASPLANEIALISGQGPTDQTQLNCPVYANIAPAETGSDAQVLGQGCAYPASTPTLANQLTKAGDRWRAYVQGIGDGARGLATTCRHPALGADDADQAARPGDPYVTWSNPFVYFHSLTNPNQCRKNDVGLDQLAKDLKKASTTPAFSYIAADPCDDGSDQPCAPAAHAGLAPADTFLKSIVPEIEHSPAYKQNGLIAITFDEAPQSGALADSGSCCDQPTFPNLTASANPTTTATTTTPTTTTATTTTATTLITPDTTTTAAPAIPAAPVTTATTSAATTTPGAGTTGSTTTSSTATTTCSTTTATGTGTTSPGTGTTTTGTTTTGVTTTSTTTPGASATTTATTTSSAAGTTCTTAGDGSPPAGGQVGLLLISRYVKPGSLDSVDTFNHFSLLKSIEDLFGLKHLGYATDPALPVFDAAIFNAKAK